MKKTASDLLGAVFDSKLYLVRSLKYSKLKVHNIFQKNHREKG